MKRGFVFAVALTFYLSGAARLAAQTQQTQPIQEQRAQQSAQPSAQQTTPPVESTPAKSAISYVPNMGGVIKARAEYSTNAEEYQFSVRNARLRVFGNASPCMIYRTQVDFSDAGKFTVLDAHVVLFYKQFKMTVGQQNYYVSTDVLRGADQNMFVNRSFISKYLASYSGSELSGDKETGIVRNMGSRDIGALFNYQIRTRIPISFFGGLFNGSGVNNPQWGNKVNLLGRIELGRETGLNLAASFYSGYTPEVNTVLREDREVTPHNLAVRKKIEIATANLRYVGRNFFLEGEYAQRKMAEPEEKLLVVARAQSFYVFRLPQGNLVRYLAPVLRWDYGDNIDYLNQLTKKAETFQAHRGTVGINFGFLETLLRSELRFNYEKYFSRDTPSDLKVNKLLHDKFTIELLATF